MEEIKMLSQIAKAKLMFELMESTLLRKHNYFQMLLSSKKLFDEGAVMPWFNFNKFVAYTSPIEQLTLFEKEMLFRNFYSFQRVEIYIDTWFKRHEHLIKAFRTQKGWNESEFYLNLNETVDTPINMLNAYRDFMLLSFVSYEERPKFKEGLPFLTNSINDLDIPKIFLSVYEMTINEGVITSETSRLSNAKFKNISPLFMSTPTMLKIKDFISENLNVGRYCDIATKTQSEDKFKSVFGTEFHNFLSSSFSQLISLIRDDFIRIISKSYKGLDVDFGYNNYNEIALNVESVFIKPVLNLIKTNKDLFVASLLKFINAGNKNITKQSILNKLSLFVHQFNMIFQKSLNFIIVALNNYRRDFFRERIILSNETDRMEAGFLTPDYILMEEDARNDFKTNVRALHLLDNLTLDELVKYSFQNVFYTSVTTSKTRYYGRYSLTNQKSWSQFSTDLNEYLNFKSDTKNFLINLHPAALFNASLGYGGWSSCHAHINMPTTDMLKLGVSKKEDFPIPHHSYWIGNYQLVVGNAFLIVEPPFVVNERQWLIPNKVRTIAWVGEDYGSIRLNLPYPNKQTGDVTDDMYLEYTAVRERMANIFKPFISVPEPHTWVRSTTSGNNATSDISVKFSNDVFQSSIQILDVNSSPSDLYRGYGAEPLQSTSVLKELALSKPDKSLTLIHSADFLPWNNEKITSGCIEERLSEVNNQNGYEFNQPGGFASYSFLSKYSKNFSNKNNLVYDLITGLPFNKDYMFLVDGNDYISYVSYLLNKDKYFYCQDTKQLSSEAIKVYVDKSKNFTYFSKNFTEAKMCSVSKEYFLSFLMVDDVSVFELLKRSQVEWSFILDDFINRKLVLVYDEIDTMNNFLEILSKKTTYRWASGKMPHEYHFDTTKAIVLADGVLKLKSIDDLKGFKIVDVKNIIFK
jgi:hypothetical protein